MGATGPVKVATWLTMAVLLVPGVAAGQTPVNLTTPVAGAPLVIAPPAPPPPTIPTAPELTSPSPVLPGGRPAKTFDFRPTLGVSEEYSDNFNRSHQQPISNLRSSVSPGFQAFLDTGFLTGQATFTLPVFHDSSVDQLGVHHLFVGDLAWQATPRLKVTLSDTFTHSDNPSQADRLNLRLARQEFTSHLLSLGSAYSLDLTDLTGYYRLSTFSTPQATTTSQTIGATAATPLGRIHTVTLGYEYLDSDTTVDRAPQTVFGPSADSTVTGHQVTATFSRDMTKDITAGVTAAYAARDQTRATGHTHFTRRSVTLFNNYVVTDTLVVRGNIGLAQLDSGGSSGRPLLTSNSDITYYRGPLVLGLLVERGFAETFGQGQNFGVVETSGISGSVFYRYSPLLTGRLTGGYRENKFTGVGGDQGRRDDKIVTATANVSYQILRGLTATMDYTYTRTESSLPQTGFAENRFRLALNITLY